MVGQTVVYIIINIDSVTISGVGWRRGGGDLSPRGVLLHVAEVRMSS